MCELTTNTITWRLLSYKLLFLCDTAAITPLSVLCKATGNVSLHSLPACSGDVVMRVKEGIRISRCCVGALGLVIQIVLGYIHLNSQLLSNLRFSLAFPQASVWLLGTLYEVHIYQIIYTLYCKTLMYSFLRALCTSVLPKPSVYCLMFSLSTCILYSLAFCFHFGSSSPPVTAAADDQVLYYQGPYDVIRIFLSRVY